MKSAVVTGGTGLLGSWLLKRLSQDYDRIFAIARSDARISAENRIRLTLSAHEDDRSSVNSIMSRLTVFEGNIHEKNLGLSPQSFKQLLEHQVTDFFHSAALAEFGIPYERIYLTNVLGTRNVLDLVCEMNRSAHGSVVTFHHISTVAVAGNYSGRFTEKDLNRGQNLNNTYEVTKFESEQLVVDYSRNKDLRTVIYRPGILTGDSMRGVTTNFKMLYQPIHFFAYELFSAVPADPSSTYAFVPVDRVAEAIALLSKEECPPASVYQLVNPDQITLQEFIDSICDFFGCEPPNLEPQDTFDRGRLSELQWKLVGPFIPYFNYRVRFIAEYTNSILGRFGFEWPKVDREFLNTLYRYCRECGFVRRLTIPCH